MDVFDANGKLVESYRSFSESYVSIQNHTIQVRVGEQGGFRWPEARLALNPTFAIGGTVDDLIDQEGRLHPPLHPECRWIFQDLRKRPARVPVNLYRHQTRALEISRSGESYVVTTGTGSGKSLTYAIPIVDHALREHDAGNVASIKAIVVYPMNALVNSQFEELSAHLAEQDERRRPALVRVARYTGQEGAEERKRVLGEPPDILLTNYVMLDLLLTRPGERNRLLKAAGSLRFLVIDELHSYRGRQGADVALLIRRLREACEVPDLQCIGTSATMVRGGDPAGVEEVASVATRLFGREVTTDRVITEELRYATRRLALDDHARLPNRVRQPPQEQDHAAFVDDPLAAWVESTFGVHEPSGGAGQLRRSHPITIPDAAGKLAEETGCPRDECEDAIKRTLLAGAAITRPGDSGDRRMFAFRLHQFLSKGDTVYVSLEPEECRYITLHYRTRVPNRPDQPLYPLVFCRECGQEYLKVERTEQHGQTCYSPRLERLATNDDSDPQVPRHNPDHGYLYVSADRPWSDDLQERDNHIPDAWLDDKGNLRPNRRELVPTTVWVHPDGRKATEGDGLLAAFVPGPFMFCLWCGVAYERRGREFGRVGGLSAEGRSSATTILSTHLARELREGKAVPKLLSFTDNRQDAALQAGHFNDFVQVSLLRAGLYRALCDQPDGLTDADVAQAVIEALGLEAREVAKGGGAPLLQTHHEAVEQALGDVIRYRVYVDLQRGWRLTMPDLEQTALLTVGYDLLEEASWREELWRDADPVLTGALPEERHRACRALLDQMRFRLAIGVDCLDPDQYETLRRPTADWLADAWWLPHQRQATFARVTLPRSQTGGDQERRSHNLSGRSRYGRWLRRHAFPDAKLSVDDVGKLIRSLLDALTRAGALHAVRVQRGGQEETGYRINPAVLRWRKGDWEHPVRDVVRDDLAGTPTGVRWHVNRYFQDLYQDWAWEFRGSRDRAELHAAEHTAQVPPAVRREREELFGRQKLPVLYCSPTMELGVNIQDLDAVLLRNMPPTPANYAQRSGRAGRIGQPALIVTYCATESEHDQYYFHHADQAISGRVVPPRLDLANEDLVRAHVQAIWLAETKPELRDSFAYVLDLDGDTPSLALLPRIKERIGDATATEQAKQRAGVALADDEAELRTTTWYYDGWIEEKVEEAADRFEEACGRWRALYRAALDEANTQWRLMRKAGLSKKDRDRAERAARRAEHQLGLLRAEGNKHQSDFYPYRYLASEGFLPGYAFPRLPLVALLEGGDGTDSADALLRPRFLALTEFGPRAVIYHEGHHFDVHRALLPIRQRQDAWPLDAAKRCEHCGYLYEEGQDLCEPCGRGLPSATTNLLRVEGVRARRRDRITADEEERRRVPFEVVTAYAFGPSGGHEAEVTGEDGQVLARLSYGDTTTIRRTNLGRRDRNRKEPDGFNVDLRSGEWLSREAAEGAKTDPGSERLPEQVIPYVEDWRNALVYQPQGSLPEETMATLQAALKRAVAVSYSLEESELAAEPLPGEKHRQRILLYEAAEGGAGVLRRLVFESEDLRRVAETALELLHFAPDGTDLGHGPSGAERCERACYDCLLSYTNQPDHQLLDRHLLVGELRRLARARVRQIHAPPDASPAAVAKAFARLRAVCGSAADLAFLEVLERGGYRPPTHVYTSVPGTNLTPTFCYFDDQVQAAVFVENNGRDGEAEQQPTQQEATALLDGLGWMAFWFRVTDRERWVDLLQKQHGVFGATGGRGARW